MGRKLYVGNLSFSVTQEMLEAAFAAHGRVDSASIVTNRDTGESRGFAFVEMSSNAEASTAINAMNGVDLGGRPLKVNEAKPQTKRPGGGGGGGGRW